MPRSVFPSRYLPWLVALPLSLAFANFVRLPLAVAAPAEAIPAAPAIAPNAAAPPPAAPNAAAAPAPTTPHAAAPQNPNTQLVVAQGTVRDPEGKPIKGAMVAILNITESGEPLPQTPVLTDADGHFLVEVTLSLAFMNAMRAPLGIGDKDVRAIAIIYAPGFAVAQKILTAGSERGPNLPANDLALARGWSATGQVVDKDGKPVSGAKVQANSLQLEGVVPNSIDSFIWLQGMPKDSPIMRDFQALSDDTGHFTLHDLPLGTLNVVLDDTRYVQQSADIKVSETPVAGAKPTLLTARVAAKVRGRVLYPDGKPVAGVIVTASTATTPSSRFTNTATTQPDGTYELGSMNMGKTVITVTPPSADWAITLSPEIQVKGGEETRAADLTLSKGILLAGYVREDGTKAPIAGVSVMASLNNGATGASTSATTDAQGRYQIRVPAGATRFYISSTPPAYVQNYASSPQVSIGEQSRTAPDFLLQRSLTLTGTAKDEKGQPATGAVIGLTNNIGAPVTATVDAQGNWTLRGISLQQFGNDQLKIKLRIGGEWAMRGNADVNMPSPPLALTLYHITLQDVKLHVLNPQGQPVADAKVHYRLATDAEGTVWTSGDTTSNAQGEVTLPKMRPEQQAELTATKTGYILTQSGKVSRFGGVDGKTNTVAATGLLRSSDIVMSPLDAKVTGRVLDAQGQPASGARVALLFPNDLRDLPDGSVVTDDKGQFTLTNLPEGTVTVGVAKGRAYSQATLQANGTIELKLGEDTPIPAPQNTEAAFAQLELWAKDAQNGVANERASYDLSGLAAKLVPYDPDRALRAMTDATGKVNQAFVAAALIRLAQSDPQHALEWSKKALPLLENADTRSATKLRLAVLTATADPAGARQLYDAIAPGIAPTDFSSPSAMQYAKLAALAGALKNPDSEGWLQALSMCIAAATTDEARDNYGSSVANLLAEGDLAGARKWAAQLAPKTQIQILGGLVAWAAKHDLPAAQQMIGDMETLTKRPDLPVDPVQNDGRYRPSPVDTLNTAREQVIRALMTTDLGAAKEMAKRMPDNYGADVSLQAQILARQAGNNDKDAVQTALDAARDDWQNAAGNMAFIAALISDNLPQLSAKAFQDARERLAKRTDNGRDDGGESAAFYAYVRAPFDPAESRLLIENDWLRTIDAMRKAKAGGAEADSNTWELTSRMIVLMRAMIPLDVARTNAMMQEAAKTNGDFSYYIGQARYQVINWLLADAQTRRTKSLGNAYDNQDTDD